MLKALRICAVEPRSVALPSLLSASASSAGPTVNDATVLQVWERLSDPKAVLVDVRTRAEWSFVGVPDLTSVQKQTILIEWLTFPENLPNAGFVEQLVQQLGKAGADKDTDIFFICRSGARSLQAALAMADAGYQRCHNVADGFEGPLDAGRHRGSAAGWKASGLPWVQS